jgi:DNA processing protein
MSPLRPLVLFARGRVELMAPSRRAIAVVGSRATTAYGESAGWAFAGSLARAGLPLWSGLALGVDSIAHRACLRHSCPTIAVLAGGLDHVYPPQNRGLLESIIDAGGLCLSELPPGQRPGRGHFPRRNRILAQASEAILVVEAGLTSGSLHTANFAAQAGIPVYAVPGPFSSPLSRGCHRLIADGAGIAASPETMLRSLGVDAALRPDSDLGESTHLDHSADASALLEILATGPRPADLVRRESGLGEECFLATVLDLVSSGALLQLPGDLLALGIDPGAARARR